MNWTDFLVIGLIAGFALMGMSRGFVHSIFKLASFFVSIVVSVKFYPVVAQFLMKTSLFLSIKTSIFKNLMLQHNAQGPQAGEQVKDAAASALIEKMHLPEFMKNMLKDQMPNPADIVDVTGIMDFISDRLAAIAIDVISLVLLYILIRIALIFVRFILKGVAKLPIFKQIDKLGGFAFGGVEGLLTVYVIFAVVMLFNSAPQFGDFFEALDRSLVAGYFYQNNFIVDWLIPGGGM